MDRRSFLKTASGALLTTGLGQGALARPGSPIRAGSAGVRGAVSCSKLGTVGGGLVEVLSGSSVIAVEPVDANGRFRVANLQPGEYKLRLQPHHAFSIGDHEDDPRPVTLRSGETPAVDFAVQPSEWYDDFQSYQDTRDLHARFANEPGGRQMSPSGPFRPCIQDLVQLDPTGGPDGGKAMRYDFWDRATNPEGLRVANALEKCGRPDPCFSMAIYLGRFFQPGQANHNQWWLRFMSKEGEVPKGFTFGIGSCREPFRYKYILWAFEQNVDGLNLQLIASGRDMNPRTGHAMDWQTMDRSGQGFEHRLLLGDASAWAGRWHTYVYGFDATNGWGDVQFQFYRDGKLLFEEKHRAWGPPGGIVSIKLGANMNAGPDQAESRWFREVGLYRSRPSTLHGV